MQALDPAFLPRRNVLSMIARLEQARSLEQLEELVYRLVSRRFGPGTAERLVPVLDPLADPECIVAVADAVLECRTAEEFIVRAREAAGTP